MNVKSERLADLPLVEKLTQEMLTQAQCNEIDWQALANMAQRRQALLENIFTGLDALSPQEASEIERVLQAVKSSDQQLQELGSTHKQELLESLRSMLTSQKAIQQYRNASE